MASVPSSIRASLDAVNEALRGGGVTPYRLELFDPAELKLLRKNARFMAPTTFKQLVANVAKDRQLESLPLVYTGDPAQQPGLVVSGNHRVQAARQAKIPLILCLVIDWHLSPDEKVSKQLAHNALAGQDDLATLKELWGSIQQLDAKVYTGIDDRALKALSSVSIPPMKEPPLKFKHVALTFLPEEVEAIRRFMAEVLPGIPADETWVARLADYRRFFDVVVAAKGTYDVINASSAVLKLVEVCAHALGLDDAPPPMDGVARTEFRVGEIAAQVPIKAYERFRAAWEVLAPKDQNPARAFAALFDRLLDVVEREAGTVAAGGEAS